MVQDDDPSELERKIAQASRLSFRISDQTTIGRLLNWISELKEKLQRNHEEQLIWEDVRARAHELWELNGRPAGRDLEFWLQAETEIKH